MGKIENHVKGKASYRWTRFDLWIFGILGFFAPSSLSSMAVLAVYWLRDDPRYRLPFRVC